MKLDCKNPCQFSSKAPSGTTEIRKSMENQLIWVHLVIWCNLAYAEQTAGTLQPLSVNVLKKYTVVLCQAISAFIKTTLNCNTGHMTTHNNRY